MTVYTIAGIDPGLVHTGVVILDIDPDERSLLVQHFVIEGEDDHAMQVANELDAMRYLKREHVFIEAYRERGQSYGTNPKMRKLMAEFRLVLPKAKVIDNTGVKKVVRKPLLKVLGLDKFPTTHHQDLEAAARILVYGMLKDDRLNRVLYDIVSAHLDNTPWPIQK